ncbi:MAG TPA: T9SS type A sorting domain-containing protein, partial [Bacteroidota bacterium]|nr:T9SS type A sorting domain-containing protein [Bacteroidota bacterium]
TGSSYSEETGADYETVRYNSSGQQQLELTYNDLYDGDDEASGITVDASGNIFVIGSAAASTGDYLISVVKYTSAGSRKWVTHFGAANNDAYGELIGIDPLGYIYAIGSVPGSANAYNYTVLKYAQDASLVSASTFVGPSSSFASPYDLSLQATGDGYLAGSISTNGVNSFSVVKFYQPPAMIADTGTIACGSASIGCTNTATFFITNSGSQPLHIASAVPSDPSYFVDISDSIIAPMDSVEMTVDFSPLSGGSHNGSISFTSDAANSPFSVSVSGSGNGSGSAIQVSATTGTNWQLISLPVQVSCPAIISGLYAYRAGYVPTDTLLNGFGYWKKMTSPSIVFSGYAVAQETVSVVAGWNMIGAISYPAPVSDFIPSSDTLIASPPYGYSHGGYYSADTLLPCYGYWIKTKMNGTIIVRSSSTNSPKTVSVSFESYNSLTISDGRGNRQELYFTGVEDQYTRSGYFELPPLPPAGVFDVRFSSNNLVEVVNSESKAIFRIAVSSAAYPLDLAWSIKGGGKPFAIKIGSSEIALGGGGSLRIPNAQTPIAIESAGKTDFSNSYVLEQNYPNPFNPSTKLRFGIPATTQVSLKIYDVTGRMVATLVDDKRAAGNYEVEWNAQNVSSGIYFYKLTAGGTTVARKMAVVK